MSSDRGRSAGASRCSIVARAAIAYAIPLGVRRLSSSTRKRPSGARTTSSPAIPTHSGSRRPWSSGSSVSVVSITRAGTTPSRTIRRSP